MTEAVRIIGSFMSPYVRKVLAALNAKGIAYEVDPIVPFFGDDRFAALSPVRRIPVLIDDRVSLCDSSVICEYLEDRYPSPALYPTDIADRARARWLEEFADTRMGDVFIWRLFNQVVINPFVWGIPTDKEILDRALQDDVPQVLDYLETQLPAEGFLFGALSIADISIATFFRNASWARFTIDAQRWPKSAAFVARTLAEEAFARLQPYEDLSLRTPLPEQRAALTGIGAPITAETYGTDKPRRGFFRT